MVYTPQVWTDGAGGGTPIDAARLTHIESGISAADSAITAAQANLTLASTAVQPADLSSADTALLATAASAAAAASKSADTVIDGSANKAFTSAEKTKLAAILGTNTGDQTSVTGNAGTATKWATGRNVDGQALDGTADVTVIAPGTHAAPGKTTPVDADEFPVIDSAASNILKKLTFANLKAWVKSWIAKVDVGLGGVDNTSDVNKPVSTAQAAADAVVAAASVPKSTVTTKGDLIVGTGSATVARLAAGANGQVDVDDSTTSIGRAKVYPRALSFNLPSIGGSTANSAAQNDTAIAAALAQMSHYGELHIPPGTYDFNGFSYPNVGSISIRGSGRNKTFLRNNHATNASVTFDGTGATGGNIYGPGCELSDLALTATALRTAQVAVDSRLAVAFSIERLHIESMGIATQVQQSWAGAYRDIDVLTCDVGLIIGPTAADAPIVFDDFNVYNCRRGGWIRSVGGVVVKFVNGGFGNNTENGMVIDGFSRLISFDNTSFEGNVNDDVIIGGTSPAEGPLTVSFLTCGFLTDTLHKTRSIHYIQGANVHFQDCGWWGFSGGHYDLIIEQEGTSAQLVIDNPFYDATNQILLHKWDGNHQLPQGGTHLDSHGYLVGGVSRSGNGVSRLPSVATISASATPAINTDLADVFNVPVTATITSMTSGLTGTPYDGQEMTIRFRADGTGRPVTHGAGFTGTLLTTTVASKIHTAKYLYDHTAAKWEGVYVNTAGV